ncbi:hypothetical protein BKA82DRAFT_1007862 [Pisolithus tinctorius]|uniref:Uncharacterized protein n=1 Tax=Pisolithus tinctorius Marx 270 TaxID=870435 RepID=A0A0C3JBG4_PISTI|nr:hypothetical protein BKA82DRAFT_1007862 [Pisolithus tinctorius]KIN95021.1 hypothetical protein M404DRAFT_1007862 [Pisolithus tinctorius Marx 270]
MVQNTVRMAQHHFQKVNWAIQVPAVSETALVHSKLVAEGSGLSQYLLLVSHWAALLSLFLLQVRKCTKRS